MLGPNLVTALRISCDYKICESKYLDLYMNACSQGAGYYTVRNSENMFPFAKW